MAGIPSKRRFPNDGGLDEAARERKDHAGGESSRFVHAAARLASSLSLFFF